MKNLLIKKYYVVFIFFINNNLFHSNQLNNIKPPLKTNIVIESINKIGIKIIITQIIGGVLTGSLIFNKFFKSHSYDKFTIEQQELILEIQELKAEVKENKNFLKEITNVNLDDANKAIQENKDNLKTIQNTLKDFEKFLIEIQNRIEFPNINSIILNENLKTNDFKEYLNNKDKISSNNLNKLINYIYINSENLEKINTINAEEKKILFINMLKNDDIKLESLKKIIPEDLVKFTTLKQMEIIKKLIEKKIKFNEIDSFNPDVIDFNMLKTLMDFYFSEK